jgi:hypothetical protein
MNHGRRAGAEFTIGTAHYRGIHTGLYAQQSREGDLLAVTDLLQYGTASPKGTSAALLIRA